MAFAGVAASTNQLYQNSGVAATRINSGDAGAGDDDAADDAVGGAVAAGGGCSQEEGWSSFSIRIRKAAVPFIISSAN